MSRLAALNILMKVVDQHKSLTMLGKEFQAIPEKDKGLVQELSYGVIRWYYRLAFIVDLFLKKPLKTKDLDIYLLMQMGIYQLFFTRIPDHAAIYETVNVARQLKKEWATKLINGVLRSVSKTRRDVEEKINANQQALYAHPQWLITKITTAWPSWQAILAANNEYPPQCLRVNQLKITRNDYLTTLAQHGITAKPIAFTEYGVLIEKPLDVNAIPLFKEGFVSVQDGAAQLAANLLAPSENERILDACAAPGGKTAHILECQPKLQELIALDNDPSRMIKITDNLTRLHLKANLLCHDITDLAFWDGKCFDKILLDVPCSALGVIRRHPDIKLLRWDQDIPLLSALQLKALETVWKALKVGGALLYVTCSILPEENEAVIQRFMAQATDCKAAEIDADWGLKVSIGRQILPGMHEGMDGFYFAKLQKTA